jgi:hypothetical protein
LKILHFRNRKQEARQQEKQAMSISRMRFPSFTGKNPNTWLFMAHKFFEFHQIPIRDRIHIAGVHMKGEAQDWFYYTVHSGLFYGWETFVRELQYRFRRELQEEQEADQRLREADQRLHQELPDFDGYKVSAWIHKANQVFNYHRSPMYARVYLASFHMKGEALLWFKNAGQSSGGWEEFLDALQARFPQEWQQEENVRLSQIAKTIAEIQKFCQESRERWGKFSQKRPEEINWPLKEKEKIEEFELVHMKIESVEFEKMHPVVEKVDTQEEEDSFNHLGHHDAHNNDAIAMIPVIESRELQRRHPVHEHADERLDLSIEQIKKSRKEVQQVADPGKKQFILGFTKLMFLNKNQDLLVLDKLFNLKHHLFDESSQPSFKDLLEDEFVKMKLCCFQERPLMEVNVIFFKHRWRWKVHN